jgi:iron-sulfur cluster repair protein YtfE (RIC family)
LLDAIELLTKQHREAQEMIARLAGEEAGGESRRELFGQLKDALTLHTRMEEEVFYPELEDFEETRALVEESYDEHRRVDQLLRRMSEASARAEGETGVESSGWRSMLAELRDAVAHHVGEEEGQMFPRAAKLLKPGRLRDMGLEMSRFETGQSESDQLIYPASRIGPA